MNKARLEAFSDGVFGFAITLLVLGVEVPSLRTVNDAELRVALLQALSQLVPYITSFATIGIIWLNHHAMFDSVDRVEHRTLMLNLLLLLVVTFIPYHTAVLSRYGALLRVRSCTGVRLLRSVWRTVLSGDTYPGRVSFQSRRIPNRHARNSEGIS